MKNTRLAATLTAAALALACQQTSNQANNTADPTVQGTPYTPPAQTASANPTTMVDPTVQGTPYTPAPSRAPQTQPALSSEGKASIKRVTIEEAKQMMERGAVVIDVRPPDSYAQGHIPGSLNIPFA
ncbi:MAG TPA: rhodanese-like domain-containing protein, partial [Thermoanaerobaculia bacterium]